MMILVLFIALGLASDADDSDGEYNPESYHSHDKFGKGKGRNLTRRNSQ
jgi:hypothetical protein